MDLFSSVSDTIFWQLHNMTHQIKIVLNHVIPERLPRQSAVAHSGTKLVMRVVVPCWLHIVPLKEIVDEIATAILLENNCEAG